MKKYRFAYPKSAYVIFALILAAGVISIIFSALRLGGVGKYASSMPALDIATIVAFVIFYFLIGYNLFGSYYAFEEHSVLAKQLFFRKRVERDVLVKFVIDEASGLAALYFFDPSSPETLSFMTVHVRRKEIAAFAEDLRAFKSDIVVAINPIQKDEDE